MSPVRNCSFQVLKHVGMSAIAEDSHSFVVTRLMVAIGAHPLACDMIRRVLILLSPRDLRLPQ